MTKGTQAKKTNNGRVAKPKAKPVAKNNNKTTKKTSNTRVKKTNNGRVAKPKAKPVAKSNNVKKENITRVAKLNTKPVIETNRNYVIKENNTNVVSTNIKPIIETSRSYKKTDNNINDVNIKPVIEPSDNYDEIEIILSNASEKLKPVMNNSENLVNDENITNTSITNVKPVVNVSKNHTKKKKKKLRLKKFNCLLLILFISALIFVFNIDKVFAYLKSLVTVSNTFSIDNVYIVNFNSNTGSGSMNPQEFTYNDPENLDANDFEKTGYHFLEWDTIDNGGGDTYNDGEEVTNLGNITLYAQWEANTYQIVFYANGGTGTTATKQMTYDTAANLTTNGFSRDGYNFDKWNTEPDGSGTDYTDGQQVNNLTTTNNGTVDFYAQWEANTYQIVFHANGGTGTTDTKQMTYDTAANLTTNGFSRDGYNFVKWNTEPDGSGTDYTDGQQVNNLTTTNNGTVDLYAQWQQTFVKYAVQIYGINQDVDANGDPLGLTFGPATGDNYNNSYVTHEYEETSSGSGVYNVNCVTYNVAQDGTATKDTSKTVTLSGTRTQAQKDLYDINLREMSWAEIEDLADNSVTPENSPFYDAMLCGDTKSVRLDLNSTIASGTYYNQWGDGAGELHETINEYYRKWNPSQNDNSAVTVVSNPSYGENGKSADGYGLSHIRATLVGKDSKTIESYAGNVNLISTNSLYSCIQSDLKNIIIAKNVKYVTYTSASNTTLKTNNLTTDKIWLFSEREMKGTGVFGDYREGLGTGTTGTAYDKFNYSSSNYYLSSPDNSNQSLRERYDETGATGYTWLRTLSPNSSMASMSLPPTGNITPMTVPNVLGSLSFGFCLTKQNFSITYNLNGGTNPANAPTSYRTSSSAITLPTPTKSGLEFGGWYEDASYSGNPITEIPTGSTGNKTYYAQWRKYLIKDGVEKVTFSATSNVTKSAANGYLKVNMPNANFRTSYYINSIDLTNYKNVYLDLQVKNYVATNSSIGSIGLVVCPIGQITTNNYDVFTYIVYYSNGSSPYHSDRATYLLNISSVTGNRTLTINRGYGAVGDPGELYIYNWWLEEEYND